MSNARILADLRLAGKKGDRSALTLALDGMRTLAHSPRYWDKYLALLRNPFARLADLLVIKQGEKIAQLRTRRAAASSEAAPGGRREPGTRSKRTAARPGTPTSQRALFE